MRRRAATISILCYQFSANSPSHPVYLFRDFSCQLKCESQRQLHNASIYRGVTDNSERRGCEVAVGIPKLRMIQGVIKLRTKLKVALLMRPVKDHTF